MYLILEKKRMMRVLSIFLCVLTVGVICCAKKKEKNETIQTFKADINDKVVVLDAGHGQPDRAEQ